MAVDEGAVAGGARTITVRNVPPLGPRARVWRHLNCMPIGFESIELPTPDAANLVGVAVCANEGAARATVSAKG